MRPFVLPVAAALCALSCVTAPACRAQAEAASQTLNVAARLVVVPVTVRDNKDKLVLTLTRDDFALTVDGKAQAIRYFDRTDDTPLTLGLMVDVSGSQRTVLDAERTASSAFLDTMLQQGRDKAFVVQFGHQADLLADVTGSVPKLQAAVQKLDGDSGNRPQFGSDDRTGQDSGDTSGASGNRGGYGGQHGRRGGGDWPRTGGSRGGGTVLYDAVYLSSTEVFPKPAKDAAAAAPNRRALILLTDGNDRGSRESVTDAIESAQRADTTIYAIYYKGEEDHGGGFPGGRGGFPGGRGGFPGGRLAGFDQGSGRADGKKVLERMAGETGGRVYEVTRKHTLEEIYKEIGDDLRSQYRLGFTPVNNDDGYHRVTVDTPKQKKVVLQFRDGYYTGSPKP